jgi:hypothetical protein
VNLSATPLTAACAGAFSAIAWPMLWDRFGGSGSAFDVGLIVGTLLLVALPAHAFVLGFSRDARPAPGTLDGPFLKRIGAWIAAAIATVAASSLLGGG